MSTVSNRVAFWDGDNFVVVNKKCSKESAKAIMRALADLDLDQGTEVAPAEVAPIIEPEEVMPVIPDDISDIHDVPVEAPVAFRFPKGRYAGKSPQEILEIEKDKGCANLAYMVKKHILPPQAETTLMGILLDYFKKRFSKCKESPYESAAAFTDAQCDNFFKYFSIVLTDEDKARVSSQAGMLNFDAFLKDASYEQKQSLIGSVFEKYL